jgi:hypothetical protein
MRITDLTVDLDFWAKEQVDISWLRQVLEALAAEDRAAAVFHGSILPHARRYRRVCTRLVNLDCHSDLGGGMEVVHADAETNSRRLELHEGSWGDYVAFADKAEFVWAYPHSSCPGNCRCDHFSDDGELPFRKISRSPSPSSGEQIDGGDLASHSPRTYQAGQTFQDAGSTMPDFSGNRWTYPASPQEVRAGW